MKRSKILVFIILLILTGCQKTGHIVKLVETGKPIEVYFCPKEDCENQLINVINKARYSIHCAFFDIDLKDLINTLDKKSRTTDTRLVIDLDNYFNQTRKIPIVLDDNNQLTHNKFCIIDKKIITTGSFNPTENGNEKNNNNLIIINSKFLAENYEEEFEELWREEFGKGKKITNPKIEYNYKEIKNYFCPEDKCAQYLINEILNAEKSIYFMTFAFTDEKVADAILMTNITDIIGIFEKMQAAGKYSQFKRLDGFGINVKVDNNSAMMHHKTFIIDNKTVITGSYNPTNAGDNKNDENIVIIRDRNIAKKYLRELDSISI